MNSKGFLDHLLQTAQSTLTQSGIAKSSPTGGMSLGDVGKGALAGGALGLLLGRGRMGGRMVKMGGLAALGMMAYKAYGAYQQDKAGSAGGLVEPQTVDRLPAPAAEHHSQVLLAALVAAAKADGHVDARERELIEQGLAQSGADAEMKAWLESELAKPLDPLDVAAGVDSPELASEVYLLSLAVVEEQNFMEKAYLDGLAQALQLDPALRQRLDAQAAE
jgi:uncharacterized membrane protein YebE (DUF533 family)